MPHYPVIQFLVRHGHRFAIAVGLLPAVAGVAAALAGGGWAYGAAGIVGSVVLYVIMKSYVELVAIIADMLLPK